MGVVVYSETMPHTSHAEFGENTSGSPMSFFSAFVMFAKPMDKNGSSRQQLMANILQNT